MRSPDKADGHREINGHGSGFKRCTQGGTAPLARFGGDPGPDKGGAE
jgi:hypothetical protein